MKKSQEIVYGFCHAGDGLTPDMREPPELTARGALWVVPHVPAARVELTRSAPGAGGRAGRRRGLPRPARCGVDRGTGRRCAG